MKPSERGAALLTVLLLVSFMAVLSASALERLRVATRLAVNAGAIDQARMFGLAAEGIAAGRITALVDADPARTTLAGGWNDRETNLPLPGGVAVARVRDGGNCFNLNSVVNGAPGQPMLARPAGIAQFVTLMTLLDVSENEARSIAASLSDWIDTDTDTQPGGAEDAVYADRETPYRTANTLIADPSELRAVAGVTPEIYGKLRPWVCALPVADLSPININTLLPEQALLLAMLTDSLSPDRARALLEQRPPEGFESVNAFWNLSSLKGVAVGPDVTTQTGVKTRWFTLKLMVMLGDTEVEETGLIDASILPARLVRRSWGESE